MLTLLSVLLLSSQTLPLVQSLNCEETTEYKENNQCCKKCKPGEYMTQRCKPGFSDTKCLMCPNGYYTDEYNILYKKCNLCTMCTKEHMKYEKHCTVTHDSVCTCDSGYRCSDSKCQTCIEIQTSTPSPTKTQPVRGEHMTQRCKPGFSDTKCLMCPNGYYTDENNILYKKCNLCTMCTKEHMKYEKNCTVTHDSVCTCDSGYRCSDSKCQTCIEVQTSTPGPTKPQPVTDNVWISVSLCFACVCVCFLFTCFLLISRHARPCKRIMSASTGYMSTQKSDSQSSQCTEEEVPMPVQEVSGKTEKLEV